LIPVPCRDSTILLQLVVLILNLVQVSVQQVNLLLQFADEVLVLLVVLQQPVVLLALPEKLLHTHTHT
jgi:hypothetical protein